MKSLTLILGALLAALSARAEEPAVARAEVEKLFQGKGPFASVALSAREKSREEVVVGDMAAKRNPAFPADSWQLHDGEIVMKDVPAHLVPAAQKALEKEWGHHPQGVAFNSVTQAIQPYFFDWVHERKIVKDRTDSKEALSAKDIFCLREGSAPLFESVSRPGIRRQLEAAGIRGLRLEFLVGEEPASLTREGEQLVLRTGRNASQCRKLSAKTVQDQLARLAAPAASETDRELLALREMLEKSQAPLKAGSVIEQRVEAKAPLLADKAAPEAPLDTMAHPVSPAL